jgi:hypothetical protein
VPWDDAVVEIDHLTCCGTTPPGTAPGAFEITNQFHTASLDLAAPTALCLSSLVESASGS